MIIIADSGSTKTSWVGIREGKISEEWKTAGINPVRDDQPTIEHIVGELDVLVKGTFRDERPASVRQIFFYGAGCIPPYSTTVRHILQTHFPFAEVHVESDMLGAAIALCGHREGIACILGTGSNSCHFNGTDIIRQTPSLGFILGDEGSGSALGKRLVGDVLKKQLPEHLSALFMDETGLTQTEIIERVYRHPQPNRFLSSLVPFLENHLDEPAIHELVVTEFRRVLQRNVLPYQRPDLPVHFVGGITESFHQQLREAVEKEGLRMEKTIKRPILAMAEYHLNK